MAPSLQDLPDELLVHIVDTFNIYNAPDRYALVQLSKTCQTTRRISLPRVYSRVCIRRSKTKSGTSSAGLIVLLEKIEQFLAYLSKSDSLLSCVQHIRINWSPHPTQEPPSLLPKQNPQLKQSKQAKKAANTASKNPSQELDHIQDLIRLANAQKHGKPKIHFCADFEGQNEEFREWILGLLRLDLFQVLEIILPPRPPNYLVLACYRKEGLKQLILSNMCLFTPLTNPPPRQSGDTIETLSIRAAGQHRTSIAAALYSFPPPLRSIHIQIPLLESGTDQQNSDGALLSYITGKHKDTLEELFWIGGNWPCLSVSSMLLTVLLNLSVLKRVGIFTAELGPNFKRVPRMSLMFPRCLEELQIELSYADGKDSLVWQASPKDPIAQNAIDFIEWISDIPKNKASVCPNMKKLVLWQRDAAYSPFGPPPAFEQILCLERQCKAQSIQYYYYVGEQPPLFGIYND